MDLVKRIRGLAIVWRFSDDDVFWIGCCCTGVLECSALSAVDVLVDHNREVFVTRLDDIGCLKAHFSGCVKSVKALNEFGSSLVSLPSLTALDLTFSHCSELSALTSLFAGDDINAAPTFQQLTALHVSILQSPDFEMDLGIAQGLAPFQMLKSLRVDMAGCHRLMVVKELGQALTGLTVLEELSLNFSACASLASVVSMFIGLAKLSTKLVTLDIQVAGCMALDTISELGRGLQSFHVLKNLELNLGGCSRLRNVNSLGQSLPHLTSLEGLSLDLSGCSGIETIAQLLSGISSLRKQRPLKRFNLNLSGCSGLLASEVLSLQADHLHILKSIQPWCDL